ncbi:MAG: putative sulfate exporter family transporter [Thermaurantiacus tibetensis]|uniref:putative sulfate exporter family transporter n=1 Tax=Thermaurantiacus tibetensis TaxID=2759035 RepID=UPI00189029AD|nr:putative sulfate exporter family transporter [Thermaurantiacus tibetensis]
MTLPRARPLPQAADLFGDIEPTPKARLADHLPGLLVALLAVLAAAFLSASYGLPLPLMALLVGLALNFLSGDPRLVPGLAVAAGPLLRLGIVLLGTRIAVADLAAIGAPGLGLLLVVILLALGSGVLLAQLLGFSRWFGLLAGGSVAICGGSAALALAATLGDRRVPRGELTMVLVGISAVGAAAMALYPALAAALGLGDVAAGFLMGAAVHDVAQAVGAGAAVSEGAARTATLVKLTRVALLAPLLLLVAALAGHPHGRRVGVPAFLLGFLAVAAASAGGLVPEALAARAGQVSGWLLALAIAASAMRSPMRDLLAAGPRPLLVVLGASLVALAVALSGALLLFGRAA